MKLWVLGNALNFESSGTSWEICGIYDDESKALANCTKQTHFIGPLILNETLQEELIEWPGGYYPLA